MNECEHVIVLDVCCTIKHPTTMCLAKKKKKKKKKKRNSSHVTRCFDSNLTHHYTSEVSITTLVLGSVSAFIWLLELTWCLLLQETKPTVLTKSGEKGYLRETYFRKQCSSLIGGIKEFEILVAEFMSAISSSTHFSVSDRCRWKRCVMNIIAYSFKYNNNKNTSPPI